MITDILVSMLRENTGAAEMDSGGEPIYDEDGNYVGSKYGMGRHHESNQQTDFESEPATTFEFNDHGVSFTHSVFHWLKNRLIPNPGLQAQFKAFCEKDPDEAGMVLMESFVRRRVVGTAQPYEVSNTYNSPNALSQILQYITWSDAEGDHVLLQIHQGADVRGGYTTPRAFDVDDIEVFHTTACAVMSCSKCEARWSTDDAYNWFSEDDGEKWGSTTNLCPSCGEGTLTVE